MPAKGTKLTAAEKRAWKAKVAATAAAKAAANTPTSVIPLEEVVQEAAPVVAEDVAVSDDLVTQLATIFGGAAQKGAMRASEIAEVERILNRMDPMKYPELAENPAVQAFVDKLEEGRQRNPDIPPGTLSGSGLGVTKKVWQQRDVNIRVQAEIEHPGTYPEFALVDVTPVQTETIIWQGIRTVLGGEITHRIPRCFAEIYFEKRRALVTAAQDADLLFGSRKVIDGAADPSVINQASGRVRGTGIGTYKAGGGLFAEGGSVIENGHVVEPTPVGG